MLLNIADSGMIKVEFCFLVRTAFTPSFLLNHSRLDSALGPGNRVRRGVHSLYAIIHTSHLPYKSQNPHISNSNLLRMSFLEVTVIKDRKVGGLGSFKSRALLVAPSQVIAFFGGTWQTTLRWWLRLVLSPSD
ncbi:unnamed protein product, partial [Vitis vinifera]|uniref:Uncharacterized protein n=1 Tax=Vitis vinifera TaxID=29760 RepID=D7TYS8_VITVI